MSAQDALQALRAVGGDLSLANGQVRLRAPRGALTDDLRKALSDHRDDLRTLLKLEQLLNDAGIAWEAEEPQFTSPGCPSCGSRSVAVRELADGARFCGRCDQEVISGAGHTTKRLISKGGAS